MAENSLVKDSLLVLNVWGLHPETQSRWSKPKAAGLLIIISYLFVECLLQMVFNWKGLASMDGATSLIICFQASSKIVFMITQRKIFSRLLNKIKRFWPLNECSPDFRREISEINVSARKLMKLFIVLFCFTLIGYFSRPFITSRRTLPFDAFHPTDRDRSPQYQLQYVFELLVGVVSTSVLVAFDGLFVAFVVRINCEFKIIREGFRKIDVRAECRGNDADCSEKVKKLVRHHNLVLGCVKDVDEIYSVLLLNQFAASFACMCAGMVSVIAEGYPPDPQNISKYIMYVVTILGQLFLYCAAGAHLITESESVSEAVYESDWWVKTQPQLRRAFVMVIQRANKTEKLTAGGMFTLDLGSFTGVVRMSFSFFSLVQAMHSRAQ